MTTREELRAEAHAVTLDQWTRGSEDDGVEFTLDDFYGYTIVVGRSDQDTFWGAFVIWGSYANPQDKELGQYNTAEAARELSLVSVANELASQIEWEDKAWKDAP